MSHKVTKTGDGLASWAEEETAHGQKIDGMEGDARNP